MKICFSAVSKDKNSLLDARFGRCPYFLIFDDKDKKWVTVDNQAAAAFRGAGVIAAQVVVDLGCQAVVSGNVGPNAFNVLQGTGIKIYQGKVEKSIEENLRLLKKGKLLLFKEARGWLR